MLWKGIASCFIIAGSQGLGIGYIHNLNQSIYHLEQIKKMITYMIGEIEYLHRPIRELFGEMEKIIDGPYVRFLHLLQAEMEEKSFLEAWETALADLKQRELLQLCVVEKLRQIPTFFIYDDSHGQISSLQLFLRQVEEEIERCKGIKKERGRIVYLLSTVFGAFMIILFL